MKRNGCNIFLIVYTPHFTPNSRVLYIYWAKMINYFLFNMFSTLRALKTETYFSRVYMRLGSNINSILSPAVTEQLSWNSCCGLTQAVLCVSAQWGARAGKLLIVSKEIFYQERQNGFRAESPAAFTGRDLLLQTLRGNVLWLEMLPVLSHKIFPPPLLGLCFTGLSLCS